MVLPASSASEAIEHSARIPSASGEKGFPPSRINVQGLHCSLAPVGVDCEELRPVRPDPGPPIAPRDPPAVTRGQRVEHAVTLAGQGVPRPDPPVEAAAKEPRT